MRVVHVALVACTMAACTTAPVDQVKYFSQALSSVNTLGQPLIDDLAVAERAQGQRAAIRRSQRANPGEGEVCSHNDMPWLPVSDHTGFIRGFCITDAGYYSPLGDPPASKAIRGGLTVIGNYADVLSTLTENRNIDAALGQIGTLSSDVDALAAIAGAAAPPIAGAAAALKPILEAAARQSNAAEARRLILEGAPHVSALIDAIRRATPAIFLTLIEGPSTALVSAQVAATPALATAEIAKVDAYRVTVSNFVVLLGKLQDAWELTVAAAQSPQSPVTLAQLAQRSGELRADADAARRAFSFIRAGGMSAMNP
ncbi:hypothetical protein [Paraburkholderia sp. SIMBA_054]|uniref:hypothetical protein n=1 Tax=Paraburkholderia sp. SIMBA_054 TaxID=3085795 RepID=UPI00397A6473